MTTPIRHVTRSGQETLGRCRRRYYWNHIYRQGGLDSPVQDANLVFGIALHEGMEKLLRTASVEDAVAATKSTAASLPLDAQDLIEALIRGWHRVRWPEFQARYEVLSIEEEMRIQLAPNITLDARADACIRRRSDGQAFTLNWKTTASTWDWTLKWENDIQSWSEAWALSQHLNLPIAGTLYEGFYKGQKRAGRYISILIRGYRKKDKAGVYSYYHEYKKGYEAFDISTDFPGGLTDWIAWLPEDTVAEQFITSFPVLKNDDVVDQWIKGVVNEESDIQQMLDPAVPEEDRLTYFRQRFGTHCSWCPFRPACLLQTTVDEMAADGLLVPRVDHHAVEEQ